MIFEMHDNKIKNWNVFYIERRCIVVIWKKKKKRVNEITRQSIFLKISVKPSLKILIKQAEIAQLGER